MQVGQQQMGTGCKLLTFALGNEEYYIDVLNIREIRGREAITTVVNAPEFIKGVINPREIIVPVVDWRIKFRLGKNCDETAIVVILNSASRVARMVVDAVSGVITPRRTRSNRCLNSGTAWMLSTRKAWLQ